MSDHAPKDPAKLQRQKRLEEQLRENLKRRKAQAKARRDPGEAPDGGEAMAADNGEP
jgi:hypothetical protein